jgi:hypothetical protein
MKISEMIDQLSAFQEAYGDMEITCKETLTSTTTNRLEIIDGAAYETTANILYTERTDAFPYPHIRITL